MPLCSFLILKSPLLTYSLVLISSEGTPLGMSEGADDSREVNKAIEEGIQLALDPNLISLPLNGSTATSQPATATANSTDADSLKHANVNPGDADPSKGKPPNGKPLFKNPYEIFGQMPMQQLVPLLLQQRGPGFKFADLSEEGLINEIESSQDNSEQAANDNSTSDFTMIAEDDESLTDNANKPPIDEDSKLDLQQKEDASRAKFENEAEAMTQEQFVGIRKSMIEHVDLALNESSLALEFLSLLLSSVRESAATASMSPFLRKTAPVGSLNSDKVPLVPHTHEEKTNAEILSRGWKLRSLNESRLLLKEKYMLLNEIMTKEHLYWSNIARHISNKDVIFKMRDKNNRTRLLGIKYGYEDSGSNYRHDRGVAVLRNNPEQNKLELEPFSGADAGGSLNNERFVRVRIFTKIASEDDYILTGESSVSEVLFSADSGIDDLEDVKNQIKRLKAFAFEQELMYQLKKESSLLISYGVTIENKNKVVMELPNEKFEMELVSLDDDSVVNHVQDAPKVNDKRATLTLVTLRLLLIAMFKKNLKQRLTSLGKASPKGAKDILLLRPLLGRLRHHNYKILLRKIVKDYILDVAENATMRETAVRSPSLIEQNELDFNVAKLSKEINAFSGLLNICKTKFEINLPDNGELRLVLESPNYCNAVVTVTYVNKAKDVSFDTNFSEFKEIEEFLHFIFIEYIKNKDGVKE